ncbi:MAG TPA: glycosyltransferase, partial [Nitrososphaeraceae archaeon]|nr:glycosyltransferase [Nitrososphaeraceae archaeon]
GHNLYEYIKKFDLHNKVYFTQDMDGVIGLNDEELVELYNCFDIYVSTTQGEGFGLTQLEAQSCGIPTLITDYSACKEFVPKDNRINVKASFYEAFWDVERAIVDQDDLVSKLNKLYQNQNVLPLIGERARNYVEGYDWKYILPLWEYFIKLYAEQEFGIKEDTSKTMSKFVRI